MAKGQDQPSSYTGFLVVLLAYLLTPGGASAQETIVPLQLTFSDPGARSMGFGGAFVALADDATAALANPAGLVQLLLPEVSIETRHSRYATPYTVGGRVEGLPSGFGIDNTAGLTTSNSEYNVTGVSFLSVAYPVDNWSFALFRYQYADIEFEGHTQGLFGGGSSCCQTRTWDQRATSNLDTAAYGLSAAYRISEKLSVGLSAIYYDASLIATASQFRWDDDTPESFFQPNSYLPSRLVRSQELQVEDSGWAPAAGILWRLSESWRIGAVYRRGFEARFGLEVIAGEAIDSDTPPGSLILQAMGLPLDFPDVYGLGFVYRAPQGRLTVSFQWDRVEYSDIPRSLNLDDSTVDDANELHLGAEYVFLRSTPVFAIRLGAWLEPDHQIRTTLSDPFIRALLPRGNDEMHYSGGLGIAMKRFQVDFAVDFAKRSDTASLSAIYNF